MTGITETADSGRRTGMMELTEAAKRCLEEYLAQVRSSVRHCASVDVADVERDVMEHIEDELAGTESAIDEPELRKVLGRLGSPSQWVPREESSDSSSWLRRAVMALRSGPEDLRLGYLAFGLMGGTFLMTAFLNLMLSFGAILPFLVLGIGASFVFARASLSVTDRLGRAERWLIYPSLVVVYAPVILVILLVPVAATIFMEVLWNDPEPLRAYLFRIQQSAGMAVLELLFLFLTFSSFWWGSLCFMTWKWPAVVRDGFAPFAEEFRRRRLLLGVSVLCLTIFIGCTTLWVRIGQRRLVDLSAPVPPTPAPSKVSINASGSSLRPMR